MKTVLITGAGIGIGRATALAFAEAGNRVIVTDILEGEGQQVADTIAVKGGEAAFHRLDVASTGQADEVVKTVEHDHGPIGTLICNAGIAHKVPLALLTDEKWDHTFDIDLKGAGSGRLARAVMARS